MTLQTTRLFGLEFVSEATIDEVADEVVGAARSDTAGWRCVVTPNVDHMVRYERHPADAAVPKHAFVVLPDGMPIVWASRILRQPLRSRLAGSDLFPVLWRRIRDSGDSVLVLAASTEVRDRLKDEHPGAEVIIPPFFAVDDRAAVDALVDEIAATCDAAACRYVFVGVSQPKTHLLARELQDRWAKRTVPTPIVLLVGAAAEMYLGIDRRAPRWMQRAGLEWMHRLVRDPRRMARRYLVDDPQFVAQVWREWRAGRRS